jgi:hypothetical protein
LETLATFLHVELLLLISGLALVTGYQMLTGRINIKGMLFEKGGTHRYSPARVQMLLFILTAASIYLSQVMSDPKKLPELPRELLMILGGSNLIYLGVKSYCLSFSRKARSDDQMITEGGGK